MLYDRNLDMRYLYCWNTTKKKEEITKAFGKIHFYNVQV